MLLSFVSCSECCVCSPNGKTVPQRHGLLLPWLRTEIADAVRAWPHPLHKTTDFDGKTNPGGLLQSTQRLCLRLYSA